MSMPLELLFTVGRQKDAWRATLDGPDQVLSEYADRDTRQFLVDFTNWDDTAWPPVGSESDQDDESFGTGVTGDHVNYVEIEGPDGSVSRVIPGSGQRVTVPGAACDDILVYRVVGTRRHSTGYVQLRNGGLVLPSPNVTAREFSWSLFLTGGMNTDNETVKWTPNAYTGVSVRFEPYGTWRAVDVGFELQAVAMLTSFFARGLTEASVTRATPSPTEDDTVREAYGRVFGAIAFDLAVTERARLGVVTGAGSGFAIFADHRPLLGGPTPLWMGGLYGRYELGQHFAFETAVRAIGPQPVNDFYNDPRTPSRQERTRLWLGSWEAGVRISP
jgi:hypothetical protein